MATTSISFDRVFARTISCFLNHRVLYTVCSSVRSHFVVSSCCTFRQMFPSSCSQSSDKQHAGTVAAEVRCFQKPAGVRQCHIAAGVRQCQIEGGGKQFHIPAGVRQFHTSVARRGVEEFFGDPKLWNEADIKSGREWGVEDLRLKDNETIHKLWFVLLKERNMLLTLEAEADRQKKFMPGEDRLEKVEQSMANIRQVVKERDEALNELQLGRKEEHPGQWEYTPFGFMHYVKPKEHLIPKYMNKYWASQQRTYDPYMKKYIKLWLEKIKKQRWRQARMEYKRIQKMRNRFPDSDIWKDEMD